MEDPIVRARELKRQQEEAEEAQRQRSAAPLRRTTVLGGPAGGASGSTGGSGGAGTSLGLGGTERVTLSQEARWKRALLESYGAKLTALQRSALEGSRLATYDEGRARCERWVEENRRFR